MLQAFARTITIVITLLVGLAGPPPVDANIQSSSPLSLQAYSLSTSEPHTYNVLAVASGSGAFVAVAIELPPSLRLTTPPTCVHSFNYCSEIVIEELPTGQTAISASGPGTTWNPDPQTQLPASGSRVSLTIALTVEMLEPMDPASPPVILAYMSGLANPLEPESGTNHSVSLDLATGLSGPIPTPSPVLSPNVESPKHEMPLDQGELWVTAEPNPIVGSTGETLLLEVNLSRSLFWEIDSIVMFAAYPEFLHQIDGPEVNLVSTQQCLDTPPNATVTDWEIWSTSEGRPIINTYRLQFDASDGGGSEAHICLLYAGYAAGSLVWYQRASLQATFQ